MIFSVLACSASYTLIRPFSKSVVLTGKKVTKEAGIKVDIIEGKQEVNKRSIYFHGHQAGRIIATRYETAIASAEEDKHEK